MKNLLLAVITVLTLALSVNTQAQALNFLDNYTVSKKGTTTRIYSKEELVKLMQSNDVACLKVKTKSGTKTVISNGFKAKLGDAKFCNAEDAKSYGFTRLNEKNLSLELRKAL